jgi:hypothetical protein
MPASFAVRSVRLVSIPLLLAGVIAGVSTGTSDAAAVASGARVAPSTPAAASSGASLNAVAATSTRNAWAVGCTGCFTTTPRAVIERWNGSGWKRVAIAGAAGESLAGIAATSAHNAWAVGTNGTKTLILRWNGTAW